LHRTIHSPTTIPRMRKQVFIFDTVSLANFLLADAVPVLTLRYSGRAFVTEQVFDELASGMRARSRLHGVYSLLSKKHFHLTAMTVSEHAQYSNLITNLGRGEASCIAAATSRGWTGVTDDRAARNHCAEKGIHVTGTVGILKAACLDKQISPSEADRILRVMIDEGFYSPVVKISNIL